MKPTHDNEPGTGVFTTGAINDSSWFSSLVKQLRELWQERKNPPPPLEITAQRDPSALQNLLETRSSTASLFTQIKGVIDDTLHPRKIETTAERVEVEEIWSKPKMGLPRVLSAAIHVGIVGLALIPWAASQKLPLPTETSVLVYTPSNLILNLPAKDDVSGGGGGGGRKQLKPPSLGNPPRPAEKQLVPPIRNHRKTLILH
jgi:hypothetical protein